MRGGLAPSSTPPSLKQCGLVGGELMAPPPLAYNGLTNKISGVYFSNGLLNVDEDNWRAK